MATDRVHPTVVKAYKQLEGYIFSGKYLGVQRNREYGTRRAVFEVDSQDPRNRYLLNMFSEIRRWNSHSHALVRFSFLILYCLTPQKKQRISLEMNIIFRLPISATARLKLIRVEFLIINLG